ncbi:uncharacterized protein MONBRDRAFT_32120 [Monosiga brevicollis MX1]|uniref:PPM-type phosphatase domain-containing protein n=1 Tax=Monosiga brevicollis TaxID=81824 RepID=A9UXS1_MONBE|nr:uncharacterized protein MONBRDRAFT_32120 [Monosiga brevicollis MX1]EDQ89893.1 predicted protein [Monosiga brevicollis MX1]|eukprot:XP_001745315.1 hypothetical protein [Monosiga brevicollis MX1]
MSWPEDPIGEDELVGQLSLEAFEYLSSKKLTEEAENPEQRVIDPSRAAELARQVCEKVMGESVESMKGGTMGGVQLFDTRKVTNVVKAAAEEAWSSNDNQVSAADAPGRRYNIDIFTSRGRRHTMEDRHLAIEDLNALLGIKASWPAVNDMPPQSWFAVMDGHGGVEAAKFAQAQLHKVIAEQPTFKDDPVKALHDGFLACDKMFLKKSERDALTCGATAVTVLVRGRKLYVAWLGDSQVAMCRNGEMVTLMNPHKPEREDEKQRIADNEGVVVWYGAWRVNGVLSVSRAIGDRKLKQWVIGKPDIAEFDITDDCEYLIAGCDGLWDVMNTETVRLCL